MSPGATFERVYNELKRMLAEGELPPGTPIEPALIGKQIAASITPVRDALHRLTGERLVEAPNHNGFRVPLPTEAALRDLYDWNAQLLGLAARRVGPSPAGSKVSDITRDADLVAATASLFVEIVGATGSREHVRAIQQLNDRLAPFRRVERQVLQDVTEEHHSLLLHYRRGDRAPLASMLDRYRRRRSSAVPHLLAAVHAEGVSGRANP
ncbi:GntR family transcriptional regulator [Sphingomonas sp. S2-65]|uniref:GntR family transcriptional regulator n=1 Tax=Sphingomonas sp. S2-65 TaxID=2903960 RepID=UPI001F3D0318|nr:GntR family transcriptional regulator [Sphingomonas sp. S2-65]UYY57158.1 GntR family transcriptional regulator [Sphingomonas sp. S2-65]